MMLLSVDKDSLSAKASTNLKDNLNKLWYWITKCKIMIDNSKSQHVTFTLYKVSCPKVNLDSKIIPVSDSVKYFGMQLDL